MHFTSSQWICLFLFSSISSRSKGGGGSWAVDQLRSSNILKTCLAFYSYIWTTVTVPIFILFVLLLDVSNCLPYRSHFCTTPEIQSCPQGSVIFIHTPSNLFKNITYLEVNPPSKTIPFLPHSEILSDEKRGKQINSTSFLYKCIFI